MNLYPGNTWFDGNEITLEIELIVIIAALRNLRWRHRKLKGKLKPISEVTMVKYAYLSAEEEKRLVEKVDLKLLLAKNDSTFEKALDTFLGPLLLKLASPHASVRALVFDSIKHLSSRITANASIRLPMQKLLSQSKKPSLNEDQDSTEVVIYTLLFLSKAVDRSSKEEKEKLIPELVKQISILPSLVSCRLFHILCKILVSIDKKETSNEENPKLTNDFSQDDVNFLVDKFIKFFLFVPQRSFSTTINYTCPGLSKEEVCFFHYNPAINFDRSVLYGYRRALFEFVIINIEEKTKLWVPFLLVVSSCSMDISERATTLLKRYVIPYDDPNFLLYLLSMFTGTAEQHIAPVGPELQEKILGIFNRSLEITTCKDNVRLIVQIGLSSLNVRLKILTLNFVQHVAKYNYSSLVWSENRAVNSHLSFSIKSDIQSTGWPILIPGSSNSQVAMQLRRAQYETIGELLKRDFSLMDDFILVEFLLDSLVADDPQFRSTIQDCLSSLVAHFPKLSNLSKTKLRELAKQYLNNERITSKNLVEEKKNSTMSARFILLKFINAAFPFNDVFARYYNILGTSSLNRFDVVQEAFKGLNPYWFRIGQASLKTDLVKTDELLGSASEELCFPDFEELTNFVITTISDAEDTSGIKECVRVAFLFIQQTLISNAIYGEKTLIVQDENWSLRVEKSYSVDDQIRKLISRKIERCDENIVIELAQFLAARSCTLNDSTSDKFSLSEFFLLLVKSSSDPILARMEFAVKGILDLACSGELVAEDKILLLSNIFGVVSTGLSINSPTLKKLCAKLNDKASYPDMFLFAIGGFTLPRMIIKGNSSDFDLLERLYWLCLDFLSLSEYKIVAQTICCELLKFKTLTHLSISEQKDIMSRLMSKVRKSFLNDERALLMWAMLSLNEGSNDVLEKFIPPLEEVHVSKQTDYLFASGEALTIILCGWNSSFLGCHLDFHVNNAALLQEDRDFLESGLRRIFKLCCNTRPSIQKVSCVWMLSIVQYLGHSPVIAIFLRQIHETFVRFLANRDEFIRETATRGISITYELSDSKLREDMVKELFRSLTDTSKAVTLQSGTVSEETQLFEPGLMNAGQGSISTYRDLLSLANEVNDPGLVYKFMALSKNSTLWSSRKGLAFGLSAILTKHSLEDQLAKDKSMFKKLIPALYRYKFDSSETVAVSMENIWKTLVPNSSAVIGEYFEDILSDLAKNMSNQEWRVREASCLAMSSLLQSYNSDKFYGVTEELWSVTFRCMDDIKESVRAAGTRLAGALSKNFLRYISSNEANLDKAKKVLDILLPFLLGPKGLNSDAEEVRFFSVKILLELIEKSGSPYIEEHIPKLVYELTILLSAIEPQAINFLSLNAEKYNVTSSLIDKHRTQGVSTSPLMRGIENLISCTDSDNAKLHELVDYAVLAVKKTVGLPSKIAASRVIQLISIRHGEHLESYSGKLLKACFYAMDDRNDMVSLSFAETLGYLFKISKLTKCIKYSHKIVSKFFNIDDPNRYLVVGTAVNSILEHSTEQFKNVSAILMPLVFVAKENVKSESSDIFDRVWVDASHIGAGTLSLYFSEIIHLAGENIHSNKFFIRQMCAFSIQAACTQYKGSYGENDKSKILETLIEACQGRSWDGKECVVQGLIKTSIKFSNHILNSSVLYERVKSVLLVEVSKRNSTYVKKLICGFSEFVLYNHDKELLDKLISIVSEVFLNQDESGVAEEIAKPDEGSSNEILFNFTKKKPRLTVTLNKSSTKENIIEEEYKILVLKTISTNYNSNCEFNDDNRFSFLSFVLKLAKHLFDVSHSWRSEEAYFEVGLNLLKKYENLNNSASTVAMVFESFWNFGLTFALQKQTIENVKVKMIRLAGLMRVKIPTTKIMVDHSVRQLLEIDNSSILIAEASEVMIYVVN